MGEIVLIVDHHKEQQKILENLFSESGFQTVVVSSSQEALKILNTLTPRAVLIELSLPGMGGLDLCKELRNVRNDWTPIILISSKADELEAVLGLELGADDYLIKPLRMKEVIARVKAIIRRGSLCCNDKWNSEHNSQFENKLVNGDLELDPDRFAFSLRGEAVDLTRKEYELLYYLFRNKGKVLTRMDLIKELSGDGSHFDERIIDVFVSRIRKKIEPSRRNPFYIKTIRNLGYMMKQLPESEWQNEKLNDTGSGRL